MSTSRRLRAAATRRFLNVARVIRRDAPAAARSRRSRDRSAACSRRCSASIRCGSGERDDHPGMMRLADGGDTSRDRRSPTCRAIPAARATARCRRSRAGAPAWRTVPLSPAISIRAHSRHRFTPVAASIVSTMKAPPTRADVSRNTNPPSSARMNSVCETPRMQAEAVSAARAVALEQRLRLGRVVRQPPGDEDAAVVRDLHRRPAVLERHREDDFAVPDDRVDVVDVALHELLEHAVRPLVARGLERAPQLVAAGHLLDADRRRRRARLQHPRRRHAAVNSCSSPVVE